jgi:hypothetical protein
MFKVLEIAKAGILRILGQGRFYFALFVNFILIKQLADSVKGFSETVQTKTAPWIFPFLMQQSYIQLIFLLGAVLLFCDAPFIDTGSSFEMIRAGKGNWIIGKIIYTALLSGIYTFCIIILSVGLLLPRINFSNDWGKVLGTLAQTNAAEVYGNSFIKLDYGIMIKYSPCEAMLYSFLIAWCICFITGMLIMLLNLLFKKIPGAIGGMMIGALSYFQKNFSNLYTMSFFSPASWMDIGMWNKGLVLSYPTIRYMYSFLTLLIFGLITITVILFCRCDDVLKEKGGI